MTDSILVLPPGFRVLDTSGNPVSGAILNFYDAGTTTPRAVYSNSGLSTSLGTSVTTDSAGYPSASAAKTLIYTGSTAYKIVCTDASLVTLWSHDNVKGALDTSSFITSAITTVTYTLTPLTSGSVWVVGDVSGKSFVANPGAGSFTQTLPLASTANGVVFDVRHDGITGIVTLLAQGSDLIHTQGIDTARKALLLMQRGDSVQFKSDGVDWQAYFVGTTYGPRFFAVEDLRTAPAASPTAGLAYLLNGAPSGAFTSTSPACAANDIVIYDGQSNYQIFRPTTDCGWLAYDKNTNTLYQYRDSGWANLAASDSVPGIVQYAVQADMETDTSNVLATTPGRLKFSPGVAKAWVRFTGVTTAAITASYNVSSVTRTATGTYTIAFTTAFSANPCVGGMAKSNSANPGFPRENTAGTSSFSVICAVVTGAGSAIEDAAFMNVQFWGDF